MPLDRVPDTTSKPEEIDDPLVLVHRVLYRTGRLGDVFREDDPKPLGERRSAVTRITGANRADLYRLEELLGVDRPAA
jgi:hypothetical protein